MSKVIMTSIAIVIGQETDKLCAEGNASLADGLWTCNGCGRTFKRSPNQHIYAASKRVGALAAE